jgi:metal-responsive CopG/Arc/MetJ family transcriptional regulator
MKTAISLPDDLFEAAERYAAKVDKSRSQLYAEALAEYLRRHGPEEVTAAMNAVVDRLDDESQVDQFVAAAARRTLERHEW